jgi:hypothetical protein
MAGKVLRRVLRQTEDKTEEVVDIIAAAPV